MRHPKIQALIGKNARQHIWMMLVEQLVEDPHFETTAMDMEYWDTLHDKLKEKLTAAQPAPAAVPLTDEQIKDALLQYRCAHFQDEDGGLPLTDALAHAFGDTDITRAKHEIEMIVDAIAAAAAGDKP